jgi:hypothetical protein
MMRSSPARLKKSNPCHLDILERNKQAEFYGHEQTLQPAL